MRRNKYTIERAFLIEHVIQLCAPKVSECFGVSVNGVLRKGRGKANEAAARGFLMLLLFKWHAFSSTEIGRALGRHHATVMHSVKLTSFILSKNDQTRAELSALAVETLIDRANYLQSKDAFGEQYERF